MSSRVILDLRRSEKDWRFAYTRFCGAERSFQKILTQQSKAELERRPDARATLLKGFAIMEKQSMSLCEKAVKSAVYQNRQLWQQRVRLTTTHVLCAYVNYI